MGDEGGPDRRSGAMSINQTFRCRKRRGWYERCIPLHLPFVDGSLQPHGFGVAVLVDTESVKVIVVDNLAIERLLDTRDGQIGSFVPSEYFGFPSELVVLNLCDRFTIIVAAQRKQSAVENDQS
jgi:hypothetical protein